MQICHPRRAAWALITAVALAGCNSGGGTRTPDPPVPSGKSSLRQAATLVEIAALNPRRLIEAPPMQTSPEEQANLRAALPCFGGIRQNFQARLPQLMQDLDTLNRNLKGVPSSPSAYGTSADQGVKDALGYIRIMHIAETSIADPDHLAADPDFLFEKQIMDLAAAQMQLLPPGARMEIAKRLQAFEPVALNDYEQFLASQCHWDA